MSDDRHFRPARRDDMRASFAVFRRSLYEYLRRIGLATAEEAADPPIDAAWKRQRPWVDHLWQTAAENWVATDAAGRIVGWALSIERSGHLELAFFFVDPDCAARGIGARLLEAAFSRRPETRRTIMATHDPAALSLYLRSGVRFVTTACDISVTARASTRTSDLEMRSISSGDIAAVAGIEERVIGMLRETDLRFLAGNRPGWVALRGGAPVGYAFGAQPLPPGASDRPPMPGPIGALDSGDLPYLIDHVLAEAPQGAELALTVPMSNTTAVAHLLALGGKIDPFYIAVLSSGADLVLDRYIHTSPSFII